MPKNPKPIYSDNQSDKDRRKRIIRAKTPETWLRFYSTTSDNEQRCAVRHALRSDNSQVNPCYKMAYLLEPILIHQELLTCIS